MNTYVKFMPNVFLAKCVEKHEKNDVITMTTKYGQEHDAVIFNLIYQRDGFYYYSIIRADGLNAQERARQKAERLNGYADNAENRSNEYYKASQEGKDFLVLAEPIKIGHHSEKRHRALIERNAKRMDKCVEESKRAEQYESRARYWAAKANDINLSMPESLEFYAHKLETAKKYHEGLKNGSIPKQHEYSIPYAKKEVNEISKKLKLAEQLWGE